MKRILISLMCCIFLLQSSAVYANSYKGVESMKIATKEEMNHLLKLGFTEDEISTMSEDELDKFRKIDGEVVSKQVKYLRISSNGKVTQISKEQCEKEIKENNRNKIINNVKLPEITPSVIVDPGEGGGNGAMSINSWMQLYTTVVKISGRHYAAKNSFKWLSEPVYKGQDIVGISHSSNVSVITGSDYMRYTYDMYRYEQATYVYKGNRTTGSYTSAARNPGGHAFRYDVIGVTSENYGTRNHRGYMYYEFNSNGGWSNIYGHYTHQIAPSFFNFSVGYGILSVSPAVSHTEADDTNASFYVY